MTKDIINGFSAYLKAFQIIGKLKLYKYFFFPIIIGFLLAFGIITLAITLADNIGSLLASFWPWQWGSQVVLAVSSWVGGFLIVAVSFVVYKHLLMAAIAPFMSPVSEKITAHITGKEVTSHTTVKKFIADLLRGIRINLRNLIWELFLIIPLVLMSFIPILNIFTGIGIILVQAYYAGFGNMDYTLERYCNVSNSVSFVYKNKGTAIGNGLLFNFLILIPIVGIVIAIPLATIAATLETVKKLEVDNTNLTIK